MSVTCSDGGAGSAIGRHRYWPALRGVLAPELAMDGCRGVSSQRPRRLQDRHRPLAPRKRPHARGCVSIVLEEAPSKARGPSNELPSGDSFGVQEVLRVLWPGHKVGILVLDTLCYAGRGHRSQHWRNNRAGRIISTAPDLAFGRRVVHSNTCRPGPAPA